MVKRRLRKLCCAVGVLSLALSAGCGGKNASGGESPLEPSAPNDAGPNERDPGPGLEPADPEVPTGAHPGHTLGSGASAALGSCRAEGLFVTRNYAAQMPATWFGHAGGGRFYFEATLDAEERFASHVGVFAQPSEASDLNPGFDHERGSVAGFFLPPGKTVSIAVDLDVGRVYSYVNGELTDERTLTALFPTHQYRAGAVVPESTRLRFNFGNEPFLYGMPEGYRAWATGNADEHGGCILNGTPRHPARVSVRCDTHMACWPTSFESDADAPNQLVVLGVYDSGSVDSWRWDTSNPNNPEMVPTGEGKNGSIVVDLRRPGNVALVLSAYERTDWTVRVGPGTVLTSVSAYGWHHQTVTGLKEDVPVDIHSICAEGDDGRCNERTGEEFPVGACSWPYILVDGNAQPFVSVVEQRLGLPLKLFAGAYEARGFVVE